MLITATELTASLKELHLNTKPAVSRKPKSEPKAKEEPLDSWDAASLSSGDEADPGSDFGTPHPSGTEAPPPTPSTPQLSSTLSSPSVRSPTTGSPTRGSSGERPAKTDAVARRMINAALGVRTKSTKEQREFDAALKEKEKKRKEEERERKREEERREEAKRSVWDD
jgi:hypothetical protein